ncbi:MAG: YARHG domain-containing protein [Flavobacteriales bacterium]
MKYIIPIFYSAIALLIFFSCENSNSSLTTSADSVSAMSPEEKVQKLRIDSLRSTFVAPKPIVVTANKNITGPEDLIGYWVGIFEVHESLWEELEESGEAFVSEYSMSNKINLSIDSLVGDKVFGHSVVAGNNRPFAGTFEVKDGIYSFSAKEPGNDQYDGAFHFEIQENDTLMKGTWDANRDLKVSKRQYSLQKKIYAYDPNVMMEEWSQYADHSKSGIIKKDIGDGEIYEMDGVLASTEDAIKFNASNTLLTKEMVENLTKADILVIRNTIFARHGFSFKQKSLRNFFDFQDWYIPVQTDVRHELTDLEIKNIELLMRYEAYAKEHYDYFGR